MVSFKILRSAWLLGARGRGKSKEFRVNFDVIRLVWWLVGRAHLAWTTVLSGPARSVFVWLVADGWRWFFWEKTTVGWLLVAGLFWEKKVLGLFWEKTTVGWFLVADLFWEKKYCWLVGDKLSEHGVRSPHPRLLQRWRKSLASSASRGGRRPGAGWAVGISRGGLAGVCAVAAAVRSAGSVSRTAAGEWERPGRLRPARASR
jgi:hypothetical protein